MLFEILLILASMVIAAIAREKTNTPPPVTLLLLAMAQALATHLQWLPPLHGHVFTLGNNPTAISDGAFDTLVFATLPLLIAADAMKLRYDELKTNFLNLFMLAVAAILLSVFLGVLLLRTLPGVQTYFAIVPTSALVMLMAMLCATDPVTVSSVFSSAPVPHKLRFLTEGESLFNDATALIIFSLARTALSSGQTIPLPQIAQTALFVVFVAIAIGLACGFIGYLFMKATRDPFVETASMLLAAYASYQFSEHFHASGILAVITATVLITFLIRHSIFLQLHSLPPRNILTHVFDKEPSSQENFDLATKLFDFLAFLCATALFMSIALSFNFSSCLLYWKESLILFLLVTCIRAISLSQVSLFASVYNYLNTSTAKPPLTHLPRHWLAILTFAGSKGALSIVMVHLVPTSYPWATMIEAIVINNIILSILVYAPILLLVIRTHHQQLQHELSTELTH